MKAAAHHGARPGADFYTAQLAPVNQQSARRTTLFDATLLVVLFLEAFAVVRLLLAN